VDITVARIAVWPDLNATGDMQLTGAAWPGPADPQPPPRGGTGRAEHPDLHRLA
jgi:hypothetical protein